MSPEELLVKLFGKALSKFPTGTVGIGVATEITDNTCTVQRTGAPELYDVRFHAVEDTLESYITIIPKENSFVLYATLGNQQTDAVIITCSEIEKVVIKIGTTLHEVSAEGHDISRGNNNLKDSLVDLITEIQKIIVINGTSPNVPALEAIKAKINLIFK